MYSSSEFAAAFNETQQRGRQLMEEATHTQDIGSQSAESQNHQLLAKPIQTDNSYSKSKAGRGYGATTGVRTMTHESLSKKHALDRVKELPVITHKKETESASMLGSKNDRINSENRPNNIYYSNSKAERPSTSQDAFHNLDLNLAGIDSKLRTPNQANEPRNIASA